MLRLCYSALSPYSRKVRMAMDHMGLAYDVFDSCDIRKYPAWNPRAEIPILTDGPVTVRNSSTILDYLHKRFPTAPSLHPQEPGAYAAAKEWELIADTMVDPIVTNLAIFAWGDLPSPPDRLLGAARRDIALIYDRLEAQLAGGSHVVGDISIADVALYPQIHGAQHVGLAIDANTHPRIAAWLKRVRRSEIGKADRVEVLKWWKARDTQDVETDKINWGTYRLEWFLAHGFHDWFFEEIRQDRVLWSVGPQNNARNSPLYTAAQSVADHGA
ncbi:MAG: glutathione S-transferase family protein [Pseudomonadota bacterium]